MDMAVVSGNLDTRARKNERIVLQRLASVGQSGIAEILKVDESTVSRLKDGTISRFAVMLAAMNLKIVPVEMKCYLPEEIDPYIQIAKQHMRRLDSAHDLAEDDPE